MQLVRRDFEAVRYEVATQPETSGLPTHERPILLRDLASLRRHVYFTCTLKVSWWQQLPWVLFGIAHHREATARQCARRALQLYHSAGPEATHHWVAHLLLGQGTMGFEQMVRFVEGAARLDALPILAIVGCPV